MANQHMISTQQAADAFGLSLPSVRYLVDAGLVPGATMSGNRRKVPYGAMAAIAARPAADLSVLGGGQVAVLRVAPAAEVDEVVPAAYARTWEGFHAGLAPHDLVCALQGWWRCDPAQVEQGAYMPVTLAGFCVAILTDLRDPVHLGAGAEHRWCFPHARLLGHVLDAANAGIRLAPRLTPRESSLAQAMLAGQLDSTAGGPIAYVATRPALTGAVAHK